MERSKARNRINSPKDSNNAGSNNRKHPQSSEFIQRKRRRPIKAAILQWIQRLSFPQLLLVTMISLIGVVVYSALTTSTSTGKSQRSSLLRPRNVNPSIGKLNVEEWLRHVGWNKPRPRTIGYYFSEASSDSLVGVQTLPTHRKRRSITHNTISRMSSYKAQHRLKNSDDYEDRARDTFEHDFCKAPFEWMQKSFPTCNLLHERDLTDLHAVSNSKANVRMLGHGYWRDVWKVKEPIAIASSSSNAAVLKTLRYTHDYSERNYDRHRRDALATERLGWSDNVIDIYSFCGNSGIYEYAPGGDIEEMLWHSKEPKWNSTERLMVAFQVAVAIQDTHDSEKDGIPVIAHTDITTSQFVHVGGRYKLNDFNRCRFMPRHTQSNKTCGFTVGNNPGDFRSPEEYLYELETEKVDIYSMGNVFFVLLEEDWPFHELEESKEARKRIKKGKRPHINATLIKTPADAAMKAAIEMCWKQNPDERASAKDVVQFLEAELRKLGADP